MVFIRFNSICSNFQIRQLTRNIFYIQTHRCISLYPHPHNAEISAPLKSEQEEPLFNGSNDQSTIKVESPDSNTHPYKSLFPWKSKRELAAFLKENVVYSNDGLIAINKPFGVGVLNVEGQKQKAVKAQPDEEYSNINKLHIRGIGESPYTIQDVLPHLKKELDTPDLRLLRSTGKYTSGIAVFATSDKYSEKYEHSLRATKPYPLFNFSIISVNIPQLPDEKLEERVGIKRQAHPLTEFRQPVIVRGFSKLAMERREVLPVRTSVRIKARSRPNIALLELKTSSVKWNFLQVYCADLLAPILGDHLFSSRVQTMRGVPTKIHPIHLVPGSTAQKLSIQLLENLKLLNQHDSLIIPTHIHLSSITLKHYLKKGNTVVIEAPLCPYFQWTCDTLNLSFIEPSNL